MLTMDRDNELLQHVDEMIASYNHSPDALIQVLHRAQETFGYLRDDVLNHISHELKTPLAKVYGVVTFYSLFSTVPTGKHTILSCQGTACYVKGSERILQSLSKELGVGVNETTKDNMFTLRCARCLGACGLAPVLMVDDEAHGRLTTSNVKPILRRYK